MSQDESDELLNSKADYHQPGVTREVGLSPCYNLHQMATVKVRRNNSEIHAYSAVSREMKFHVIPGSICLPIFCY